MKPLLSESSIQMLIHQQPISDRHPWASGDPMAVEAHLKATCAAVSRSTRALSRIEWNHYGSGYASFIDAWFYKRDPGFDVKKRSGYQEEHTGLVVLFSRLSPYCVFMEGEKRWDQRGTVSYMPEFDMVDRITTPAVAKLSEEVQPVLESFGLIRVGRSELHEPLSAGVHVATNLATHGLSQFDALFHWED
ncbi:hypothetical protein [Eleftheria terrae]|uniref:hypothetical protein n=1 Tax=Eleftheria terrae TaxID=1597781 RepID=UPI00263BD26B|nr:hypothetical protein [Eleftheria terrae]WKB53089.1 hypothetical protein N7L95_01400 [Eleftheria terrae]